MITMNCNDNEEKGNKNMEGIDENSQLSLKNTITETEENQSDEAHKNKEKLEELEKQYLRLLADYQNLQKRTAQEKEELYKYAAQKTIEVLLPALDTFDYAKQAVKPDSKPEKIMEDFNLVFEMLLKCLKDVGLEAIEETGIPFDPFCHEVLNQVQTNELPNHTVVQVLKKGYMLNKKVIRPALISVSVKQDESV